MKKTLLIFALFALFSNSYAQNDSIRTPVECGTGRVMQQLEKDRQKIIEDFIFASEKDMMFGNGLWMTIGKQNTDEDILKEGLKGYDWKNDNITILKNLDDKNHRYILFSHQKEGEKAFQAIGMYSKTGFSFRVYDAFYWKNQEHPEVLGKWIMSEEFSPKGNETLILKHLVNDYDYGYFIEIKEDYTFETYLKDDCPEYVTTGRYYFDEKGISFNCYDIQYLGKKKEGKPFVSGPFKFTIENGVLILKK